MGWQRSVISRNSNQKWADEAVFAESSMPERESLSLGCASDEWSRLWNDDLRSGIWPRSVVIWVVALWIALLIFRPWETLIPELAQFRVERSYAIVALLAVLFSGRARFVGSMQTSGLLLWAAALTVSASVAFNRAVAWDVLYVYYTVFVFYFVVLSVVRTPYELVFLVISFVVVVIVFLGKSQWEYFLYGGYSYSMGVRRLTGANQTYSHPNSLAAMAVLTLPFLWFLWTSRSLITARWPAVWHRLFPWGLVAGLWLCLSSVQLTNSRSGMVGVIVAALLWIGARRNIKYVLSRLAVGLLILTVLWCLMPESSRGRFQNIWDPEAGPHAESAHASAEGRIIGLQQGIEMFQRFPITGVGLGNFIDYRVRNLDGVPLVAHNTIGGILGETGLVGGLAFLVFVSGVFVNCARTKRLAERTPTVDTQWMERLAVACRNSMILILFVGMFGDMQGRAQLYWIAAFCSLAWTFCQTTSDSIENEPYD